MEFKNLIFQTLKVMKFYGRSWKVMENYKWQISHGSVEAIII